MPRILIICSLCLCALAAAERPNVLVIISDDLRTWLGCYGETPRAMSPNLDALAAGGVRFTNAHVQEAVCNPSRTSLLWGLAPRTSGVHGNQRGSLRDSYPLLAPLPVLPQYIRSQGYRSLGVGKIYHSHSNDDMDLVFDAYGGEMGRFGPYPPNAPLGYHNPQGSTRNHDWGVYPEQIEQYTDHKIANWAIQRLEQLASDNQGWMLTVGFMNPHTPWYAPQRFFDLYPEDQIPMPPLMSDDLADVPAVAHDVHQMRHGGQNGWWNRERGQFNHDTITAAEQWREALQAYLACVSFLDYEVGRVLDTLRTSGLSDNTIVVFFGDHGYHHGEKQHWWKGSLWDNSTRVPLLISGPGIPAGTTCHKPVGLLDLYPTIVDLVGMTPPPHLEGRSLRPLLQHPDSAWPHMVETNAGQDDNRSLVDEHYRYTRYFDGSEEFYDRDEDPHEFHNRIDDPAYTDAVARMRAAMDATQ